MMKRWEEALGLFWVARGVYLRGFQRAGLASDGVGGFFWRCEGNMILRREGAVRVMLG